jgi:hypothetical protein
MAKVTVYVRESNTRNYQRASPKIVYPVGTFVLRYLRNGKRNDVLTFAKISGRYEGL